MRTLFISLFIFFVTSVFVQGQDCTFILDTPDGTNLSCNDDRTVLVLRAVPPEGSQATDFTYTWNKDSETLNFPSTTSSISANMRGEYSVTVTGMDGCTSELSTMITGDVVAPSNVSISTNTNGTEICGGTPLILTANADRDGYTYRWSKTEGGNSIGTESILQIEEGGSYYVTVTNTLNGCTTTTNTTINEIPEPTVNSISDMTICDNQAINIPISGSENTVFKWSNTNANIGLADMGTSNNLSFVSKTSGNTTTSGMITITPTIGTCEGNPITFNIVVTETLSESDLRLQRFSTATTDNKVCFGDRIILSVDAANATCAWSSSNSNLTSPAACTWDINELTATTDFTVTITTAAGCSTTIQKQIEVGTRPDIDIDVRNPCQGQELELKSRQPFDRYEWIFDNEVISNNQSYSISNASATSNTGVYTLNVTDGDNCKWTDTRAVTIRSRPSPQIASDNINACLNQQAFYTVSSEVTEDSKYKWELLSSGGEIQSFECGPNVLITWTESGSHQLRVTETLGAADCMPDACSGEDIITINVGSEQALPQVEPFTYDLNNIFVIKDPDAACYQWGNIDENGMTAEIPGETFQSYFAAASYNPDYTYWVKRWNGDCSNPDGSCATVTLTPRTSSEYIEEIEEDIFRLFPNPNKGNFTLEVTNLTAPKYDLLVSNAWGQILQESTIYPKDGKILENIVLEEVANGVFFTTLLDQQGVYKSQSFVVYR